jgi:hypothetical protein
MDMFNKGASAGQNTPRAPIEFPETTSYTVTERGGNKKEWQIHLCQVDSGVLMLFRYILLSEMQPMPYVVKMYGPGEWRTVEGEHDYKGWQAESPLAL